MKLVSYLYKRFFPVFIGAIGFFSLVLVLVDLFMNLWKFIQNESPILEVVYLLLLYVPKTMWYAIPLGILFASSYTLSNLYATNELTAIFASGVSLFKFTLPLLIFSFLMSFGLFIFEDYIVVPTYEKKLELQTKLLKEEKSLNNDSIVVISDGGKIIYKADSYEASQHRLYEVIFVFRTEDKKLDSIIQADSAYWNTVAQHWSVSTGIQYTYKDGEYTTSVPKLEYLSLLTEPYETFQNNTVDVEGVNAANAKIYINHLKRAGLPYSEELSVYYKKFAFPFIVFIVVFLSIGLSGRSRKNVLLLSLTASISAAVLFYVTQMLTMLLAKFGYISPFAGAWFPVILFIFISIALLRTART